MDFSPVRPHHDRRYGRRADSHQIRGAGLLHRHSNRMRHGHAFPWRSLQGNQARLHRRRDRRRHRPLRHSYRRRCVRQRPHAYPRRRSQACQPSFQRQPRRFRDGRRLGGADSGGNGTRPCPRCAHLCGDGGIRQFLRRLPRNGSQARRKHPGSLHQGGS